MINKVIEKIQNNPDIRAISFDVFDTLLFRMVSEPAQVFEKMYSPDKKNFPDYTNEEDWKNARIYAEQTARKKAFNKTSSYEVTIDDIYNYVPSVYKHIDELKELEVECEIKYCYLNMEMYETLKYIKEQLKLPIVLISDMYLGKENISKILKENGLDIDLIKEVFISCDYGVSKRYEGLYHVVLESLGIEPHSLLHIGDNNYSDIGVAGKLGINTYFYPLISEAKYTHPYLFMEKLAYGDICKEIHSLRLIAANNNNETTSEEKVFYDIGAMIVGPLFTYATEWVMDVAEEKGIKIIRPLMREGKLLTELLRNSQKARGTDLSIEPLYISRFAVFTANFENCTENDVQYLFSTYNITLRKVFEILNIQEVSDKYSEYLDKLTVELKNITLGDTSIYNEIINYLVSKDIIELIKFKNKGVSKKIIKYFRDMNMDKLCITLDVGWRGNIQNAISRLLYKDGISSNIINLLFFSGDNAVTNASKECYIRGFIGNFGKEKEKIQNLLPRLVEMFFLNLEGTTIGYIEKDDCVVPQKEYINYPKWQVKNIEALQRGIRSFQDMFLSLSKKKVQIREWKDYRGEICCLLERLCSYPLTIEAKCLGKIQYDQNFGSNSYTSIINKNLIKESKKIGLRNIYGKFNTTEVQWFSGMNAIVEPAGYYENLLKHSKKYMLYSLILICQKALDIANNKKIILVGSGKNAEVILIFMCAIGRIKDVEVIVDNDSNRWCTTMAGIKIDKVEAEYTSNIYLCTTTNKVYRDALYKQIKKFKYNNFQFISYYREDDMI